ncbi:MAG: ZIP family metal transporter [Nanoarchaeota archaeon]|nr:ZIP family metal transporter [Nanoarchaeota archaeon]
MANTIILILLSVFLVSLISFIGIFTLSINSKKLKKTLIYLISFSAGALLGDAFIHLLPEIIEANNFTINTSLLILLGIIIFFVLEKFIHWEHCHGNITQDNHVHPFAYMNLVGDALHNFIDGSIIAASYFISVPVGIATTIAVCLHEIPQEIGDFGVLIHGGFTKAKALAINFLSAITALLGALITILAGKAIENIELLLIPIAAGGFIYIAGSDLIPELHKETKISKSLIQLISLILGVLVMLSLLLLE